VRIKPLYILFAWFLAAILGKMGTDKLRERLSKKEE